MPSKVWIDGKLVDKNEAKISVYDHGLLYGDGVFEGIRYYNGKIFEPEGHIRRLFESARAIRLNIPYTAQQLLDATDQTVKANGFRECYIRMVVTRGVGYLGLNPFKCPNPSVFIIADTIELYPKEIYENGMTIITSSIVRNHPNALSPRIKSLNYLNNILAKLEANDAGVSEALMLNPEGFIAECTADNIYIVRGGIVLTPDIADGVLEGVTRSVILKLCVANNIPMREATLTRHDVYVADECFLSGTAAEIVPVTHIDGRSIGNGKVGPITQRLIGLFRKYVAES